MPAIAEPRTRRWVIVTAVVAAAAAGAASEAVPRPSVPHAVADVATGWMLLACGAWGLARRPRQARWWLLGASGALWFAGNLSLGTLAYAHRGPLVNAAVAARSGARRRAAPSTARRFARRRSPVAGAATTQPAPPRRGPTRR